MTKLMNNKRGVSPLIATILLIAFAVALGAVVMSIGRTTLIGETTTGLSFLDIQGKKQICYADKGADSILVFTIRNGETDDIDDFQISIIGSNEIQNKDNLLTQPIRKAEVKKLSLVFDKNLIGNPTKIIITPKTRKGPETVFGKAIQEENIGLCGS